MLQIFIKQKIAKTAFMRCGYLFLLLLTANAIYSQNMLLPGDISFEKKWLKGAKQEMSYYILDGNNKINVGLFTIEVKPDNQTLTVITSLNQKIYNEKWVDTSIADINTFQPIYRYSGNNSREFAIKYGREAAGIYYDKKNNQKYPIKQAIKDNCFDSYMYPYLLRLLPLKAGYKATMPVFEYHPENTTNVKQTRIEEVKTSVYVSSLTGEHKVWAVTVYDESIKGKTDYYIDKTSHRLWKIEILADNHRFLLTDNEIDFNPFTYKFNKEQTLKLITSGKSVINGEVFVRDNSNEGLEKGMAVLNINKKQFAKKGTSVILIPYTNFFKEWMTLNDAARKKGTHIPLPEGATECIKVTSVYDDKGNFEFVNLLPGEYMLYTQFGFIHTAHRTEVIGYTDTYINGTFQGSTANTQLYTYGTNANAAVKKIVTIKTDGETVTIKLKKTR